MENVLSTSRNCLTITTTERCVQPRLTCLTLTLARGSKHSDPIFRGFDSNIGPSWLWDRDHKSRWLPYGEKRCSRKEFQSKLSLASTLVESSFFSPTYSVTHLNFLSLFQVVLPKLPTTLSSRFVSLLRNVMLSKIAEYHGHDCVAGLFESD